MDAVKVQKKKKFQDLVDAVLDLKRITKEHVMQTIIEQMDMINVPHENQILVIEIKDHALLMIIHHRALEKKNAVLQLDIDLYAKKNIGVKHLVKGIIKNVAVVVVVEVVVEEDVANLDRPACL